MKRIVTVWMLVLLVIAAGCLGASTPAPAADGDADDDGLRSGVSVSASGAVAVEPDLARVHLTAEARAESADDARAQVAADVAAVRAALADLGLSDDAVTTAYYRIDPQYEASNGERRELTGYRAVHALTVEAGVDQAGAVIDAAVGAGAVRVDAVQFTLTDEARQSAREQAIADAMANAAADAAAIADAADLTLDGVRSASTVDAAVVPFEVRSGAAEADGATGFQPGPVEVTASVQVVYRIA